MLIVRLHARFISLRVLCWWSSAELHASVHAQGFYLLPYSNSTLELFRFHPSKLVLIIFVRWMQESSICWYFIQLELRTFSLPAQLKLGFYSSQQVNENWSMYLSLSKRRLALTYLSFTYLWFLHQTLTYRVTVDICYAAMLILSSPGK